MPTFTTTALIVFIVECQLGPIKSKLEAHINFIAQCRSYNYQTSVMFVTVEWLDPRPPALYECHMVGADSGAYSVSASDRCAVRGQLSLRILIL